MNQNDTKLINARDKFPKKRFKMPEDFPEYAVKLWKDCESYAWKTGLLTDETLPDFVDMCRIHDELIKIRIKINKEGFILKTVTGIFKENPLYKQERKLQHKFLRYSKKFGMTPLSRAKKGLPSPEDLG